MNERPAPKKLTPRTYVLMALAAAALFAALVLAEFFLPETDLPDLFAPPSETHEPAPADPE